MLLSCRCYFLSTFYLRLSGGANKANVHNNDNKLLFRQNQTRKIIKVILITHIKTLQRSFHGNCTEDNMAASIQRPLIF